MVAENKTDRHIHYCPQECSEGCHDGHDWTCEGQCKGLGGPKKKTIRCAGHAIYKRVE